MNRIHPSTGETENESARSSFNIESGLISSATDRSALTFFGPQHYEPGYAYPLIVWLHTPGADEQQLMRIMPLVSLRNYVAVAPRGFDMPAGESGGKGHGWPQSPDHVEQAECRVMDAIQAASRKFNLSEKGVFLAGFDSGGTMACRIAMNSPGPFAGVLSICGAFPSGRTPLGRLSQARLLPVFLALGRDSSEYPPDKACDDLRLLHTAGITVTLRQYPCGQQLTEQMLRDVNRWIMQQITTPAEPQTGPEGSWC